jgi:hypothetical protein
MVLADSRLRRQTPLPHPSDLHPTPKQASQQGSPGTARRLHGYRTYVTTTGYSTVLVRLL